MASWTSVPARISDRASIYRDLTCDPPPIAGMGRHRGLLRRGGRAHPSFSLVRHSTASLAIDTSGRVHRLHPRRPHVLLIEGSPPGPGSRALTRASGLDCRPELPALLIAYLKAAHA